jgi:hypothetical protein
VTGQELRQALLDAVNDVGRCDTSSFQTGVILRRVADKLGIRDNLKAEQALLTMWHDLFRQGMIAWGYNISNSQPPFCHLTEQGRAILGHMSRDPLNPDGYMAHMRKTGFLNPVAASYLTEALMTFNAGCPKATAVMVGAAAESLSLDLRDALVAKLSSLQQSVPRALSDWRIKPVLDTMQRELGTRSATMPHVLAENYQSYWPAFTQQIRCVRNDAGHPASIDPVTHESVHAALLIFPELAALAHALKTWVVNDMT